MSGALLTDTMTPQVSVLGMVPRPSPETIRIESERARDHAFKEFSQGVSGMIEEGRTGDTAAVVESLVKALQELSDKQVHLQPRKLPSWLLTTIGGLFLMIMGGGTTWLITYGQLQQRVSNAEARLAEVSAAIQKNSQDNVGISVVNSKVDTMQIEFNRMSDRIDKLLDRK
jgi:hypothetical protein